MLLHLNAALDYKILSDFDRYHGSQILGGNKEQRLTPQLTANRPTLINIISDFFCQKGIDHTFQLVAQQTAVLVMYSFFVMVC